MDAWILSPRACLHPVIKMQGGTVYRTDSWGTRNSAVVEQWEGQPNDYVHFKNRLCGLRPLIFMHRGDPRTAMNA